MNKFFFTTFISLLFVATLWAQSPNKMSYQSVVRDTKANLVKNTTLGMQISILQGGVNGTVVYTETQSPVTNANGLATLVIGEGNVVTGSFSAIDWANGPYFIKTETDISGGTNYTITGTSQLLSVPYAMHATTAESLTNPVEESDPVFSSWDKSSGIAISESQITDLKHFTNADEADPRYSADSAFIKAGTRGWNSSLAKDIDTEDTTRWGKTYTETDPLFTAWDKSSGISIKESQVSDLEHFTNADETDPVFEKSIAKGITQQDTAYWNQKSNFSGNYQDLTNKPTGLSDFTNDMDFVQSYELNKYLTAESDPKYASDSSFIKTGVRSWNHSLAKTIDASDTTRWGNKSETDPLFSAWDKSSGITITESQITDLDHFTNTDETDPKYATDSSSIKTSVRSWDGSLAKTIDSADTTRWGATETDPLFSVWDKSSGITITESQITDLDHFTNADETDPKYAADSSSIKTSVRSWDGSLAKTIDSADTTRWGSTSLDDAYNNGSTITADAGPVTIAGTAGLISTGTYGSGTDLAVSGAGTRMIWYPKRAAFRAGNIDGTQWDYANIGTYSTATGLKTIASGGASTAMGSQTTASFYAATAMGGNTTASGENSTAMGYNTTASGKFSTAMGGNTNAASYNTTAMGESTLASGYYATAMGNHTTAQSLASLAIGQYNLVSGTNNAWVSTDPLFVIGNGTDDSNRSNALTVLKNGNTGIGVADPDTTFEVAGLVKITGGTPGAGKVLTSDANGLATWSFVQDTTSLDDAYNNGSTITADAGPVTIAGTDGLISTGTYGSGTDLTLSGAGTRMIWYPKKAAFRAGNIDGTQWDNANIGNYSTATGLRTSASGNAATAMGATTTASGGAATAMGGITTASGDYSTAMGYGTTASVIISTAMGYNTTASGKFSTAMGAGTTASGESSFATGNATTASNNYAAAMGVQTNASGIAAIAMGQKTTAQPFASLAIGRFNEISGTTDSWINTDPLFVIGNGTSLSSPSNALTVLKNGNTGIGVADPDTTLEVAGLVKITGGTPGAGKVLTSDADGLAIWSFVQDTTSLDDAYNNGSTITADAGAVTIAGTDGLISTGTYGSGTDLTLSGAGTRMIWYPKKAAFRVGYIDGTQWDNANIGALSIAMGSQTTASGYSSTAMGTRTTANGMFCTAIGYQTIASVLYSTAIGAETTASGTYSTAMGIATTASGYASTSMGYKTAASDFYSTAMGYQTKASGQYSTAMGGSTTASGDYSTAMGVSTTTSGDYSAAMGYGTNAQAYASLAIGQYNVVSGTTGSWVTTEPLFVCGNGSASSTSNALTLLKNGNMTIAGTLTQNSDIRLKKEIVPLTNVLPSIERITPIYYRFKDTQIHPEGRQIGFSAQEIEKEFPELVTKDSKGYLSVEYANMTAVLLQAIKELKGQNSAVSSQNDELKATVAEQNKRIAELEKGFEEMKAFVTGLANNNKETTATCQTQTKK